jgi:hypothetical protein
MKSHPLFKGTLEGGQLVEWGAKTIPEGGYHSLPDRCHGDGILIVGGAAGFVDVPSLKGIHYAMHSGILAARAAFGALKAGDSSSSALAGYDRAIRASYVVDDLFRTRNMRLAFKDGLYAGGTGTGLMTLTGRFPGRKIDMPEDAQVPKAAGAAIPFTPDNALTFSKVTRSSNRERDARQYPTHLLIGRTSAREVAEFYSTSVPPRFTSAWAISSESTPPASRTRRRMCSARGGLTGRRNRTEVPTDGSTAARASTVTRSTRLRPLGGLPAIRGVGDRRVGRAGRFGGELDRQLRAGQHDLDQLLAAAVTVAVGHGVSGVHELRQRDRAGRLEHRALRLHQPHRVHVGGKLDTVGARGEDAPATTAVRSTLIVSLASSTPPLRRRPGVSRQRRVRGQIGSFMAGSFRGV